MNSTDVYNYTCYRTFLSAYANHARTNYRAWSYTKWAKRLGLKGTASLTLILTGKRLPGPLITERLINYFKFDPRERRYFLELIAYERFVRRNPTEMQILHERRRLDFTRIFAIKVKSQSVAIPESRLPEAIEFLNQIQIEFANRFSMPEILENFKLNIDLEPFFYKSKEP